MIALAEDPTSAAVLAAAPCYPVPPSGQSPAIDAVREARVGQCLVVGRDGVCLILRRAWLALDLPVTPPIPAYLPYGSIGAGRADLRCGLIPAELLAQVLKHFRAALPNEAAAFIVWDENDRQFTLDLPQIDHATKISMVVGRLGHADGPTIASRLCAGGMFLPLPRSPFSGDYHEL